MNDKHVAWAALGALGLLIGCGGGGTTSTSTSGGGGSASTTTGAGGASTSTSTATGMGGGASASTATGAGGGNAGEVCTACVGTKAVFKAGTACAMSLDACNADPDCESWFKCVQNCESSNFTAECFGACDQSASAVNNLYQPIYDCTCNACKTECGAACP
jgi:hypothetical protein